MVNCQNIVANEMVAGLNFALGANDMKRIEMKPFQVFIDEGSMYFDRQTGRVYVGGQLVESEVKEPIILGCAD